MWVYIHNLLAASMWYKSIQTTTYLSLLVNTEPSEELISVTFRVDFFAILFGFSISIKCSTPLGRATCNKLEHS